MRVAIGGKNQQISSFMFTEWQAVSEGERDTYNTKLCRCVLAGLEMVWVSTFRPKRPSKSRFFQKSVLECSY